MFEGCVLLPQANDGDLQQLSGTLFTDVGSSRVSHRL